MIEAVEGNPTELTKDEQELLKITGILHETIEMELICHQLMFESIPVSGIGLVELQEEAAIFSSSDTDSEKDKEKQSAPNWNELGRVIVANMENLYKATNKISAYVDMAVQYASWPYRRLRVVPVPEGTPPTSANIIETAELLHEQKFVCEGDRYVLRVYQQVVAISKIQRLIDPEYFRVCVERWRDAARAQLKNTPMNNLCLTRNSPRIVMLTYPLQEDTLNGDVYNAQRRVVPCYKLNQIWEYIDIVEGRKSLYGLHYLKDCRLASERVAYYFDWNNEVVKLEVIEENAPPGLQSAEQLTVGDQSVRKVIPHGSELSSIMEALSFIIIMSRADELGIGPFLTKAYEAGFTNDLKPSYFYSSRRLSTLAEFLISPLASSLHLETIVLQLCRAVSELSTACITNTSLTLDSILYDPDKKLLRLNGFKDSRVLKHSFPFFDKQNTPEQVQYFAKLHEFEVAYYAKDLLALNDVIKMVLAKINPIPPTTVFKELQHYLSVVEERQTEEGNYQSNCSLLQLFKKFSQTIGIPISLQPSTDKDPQLQSSPMLPSQLSTPDPRNQ